MSEKKHTRVMGIVNVTPDSFSDGGLHLDPENAIAHGAALVEHGAELLDIGGESTRPGARRVTESVELDRVIPVIKGLANCPQTRDIPISIDTMRANVARAAVAAGAQIVNDVSGGLADDAMFATVADLDVDYICQHWRGFGQEMNDHALYHNVVTEVRDELVNRLEQAKQAGITHNHLIADPGLGFAKLGDQDWELLRHLEVFVGLGYRVLIGASRKRFLGTLLNGRQARDRDAATAAVSSWCAQHGVWAVRTHEVISQVDAIAVTERLMVEP